MQWQVDESKRSSSGGGLVDHGELIEVLSVPLNNTGAFLMDPSLNSSPGLMYGLLWARDEINAGRVSKMYGLPETTQEEGTETQENCLDILPRPRYAFLPFPAASPCNAAWRRK